jgi:hypothetical protein
MKTYISRSSGRDTTSLRCISCISNKMIGKPVASQKKGTGN